MGIRFLCPNGHKLNVKTFLAGKRAICPDCGARVLVPSPADELPAEARQIGTSQSEAIPSLEPVPEFSFADTASTSVVIAVASADSLPPAESPAATQSPADFTLPPLPDSIVAVLKAPAADTDAELASNDTTIQLRRERTRRKQILFAIALLVLVLVLAVVLVIVMKQNLDPLPAEPEVPATTTTNVDGSVSPVFSRQQSSLPT